MKSEIIMGAGPFEMVKSYFQCLNGVLKATLGYMGGQTKNPTFDEVSGGSTGHAFTVEVVYDSEIISFSELLELFFMIHDPTSMHRQAHHKGSQYRSCLFYSQPSEKEMIDQKIHEISPYFSSPIITEIHQRSIFYPAEEHFQKGVCEKATHKLAEVNKEKFLQRKLSPEQYWIMRGKGTEAPFSGKYLYSDEEGTYHCAACGQKLFSSRDKFHSGSGWPAFDKVLPKSIDIKKDLSHFMIRDEVLCRRCGSHLGHVFNDGPTKTGLRYCINSLALTFKGSGKFPK